MEQIFLKGIHVNLPSLGAHTQGGSDLAHFPPNCLALLLIEQRERELIMHHSLPQAGDHSMALVLKRILHEAPDMSEIQAGMKHSLIVPVSEPYGFVQLLSKYGIFSSSEMRDMIPHLLHKPPQQR